VEARIGEAAGRGDFGGAIALAVQAQETLGHHAIYDDETAETTGAPPGTSAASSSASLGGGGGGESVGGGSDGGLAQSVARLKVLHAMRRRVQRALPTLRREVDLALWRIVAGSRGKRHTEATTGATALLDPARCGAATAAGTMRSLGSHYKAGPIVPSSPSMKCMSIRGPL